MLRCSVMNFKLYGIHHLRFHHSKRVKMESVALNQKNIDDYDSINKNDGVDINGEGYSWDYAIFLQSDDKENISNFIKHIQTIGLLETFQLKSVKDNMTILLLRAHMIRLAETAKILKMPMLLDENHLKDACENGFNNRTSPFIMSEDKDITPLMPYKYIYALWDKHYDFLEPLFAPATGLPHPFGLVQRVQIIHTILRCDCSINLDRCEEVISHFPLRDSNIATDLLDKCTSARVKLYPWSNLPLDNISSYLGTKLAFYFALLGDFAGWLLFLQILHLIPVLHSAIFGHQGETSFNIWFFVIAGPFWTVLFISQWHKTESGLRLRWGSCTQAEDTTISRSSLTHAQKDADHELNNFKENGPGSPTTKLVRRQGLRQFDHAEGGIIHSADAWASSEHHLFRGEMRLWPGDGSLRRQLPTGKHRLCSQIMSGFICTFAVFLIIVLVALVNGLKSALSGFIINVFSGVIITIVNDLLLNGCHLLAEKENHRTVEYFKNAVFDKYFPLQIVNILAPLTYIGIFKPVIGIGCFSRNNTCAQELEASIPVILISMVIMESFLPILIPTLRPHALKLYRWSRLQLKQLYEHYVLHQTTTELKQKLEIERNNIIDSVGENTSLLVQTLEESNAKKLKEIEEMRDTEINTNIDYDRLFKNNPNEGSIENIWKYFTRIASDDNNNSINNDNIDNNNLTDISHGVDIGDKEIVAEDKNKLILEKELSPHPKEIKKAHKEALKQSIINQHLEAFVEQDKEAELQEIAYKELLNQMSAPEKDFQLQPHDPTKYEVHGYGRLAGYMILAAAFSGMYSLTPLILYFGILGLLHTEPTVLLLQSRLPFPISSDGISTGKAALKVGWAISIAVATGLASSIQHEPKPIIETDGTHTHVVMSPGDRTVILFIVLQYFLVAVGAWMLGQNGLSQRVTVQLERQAKIRAKIADAAAASSSMA